VGRTDGIALKRLAEFLFEYLTEADGLATPVAAAALWRDYQRAGRHDVPPFLQPHVAVTAPGETRAPRAVTGRRQARHLAG
jgi:hypothetical protein